MAKLCAHIQKRAPLSPSLREHPVYATAVECNITHITLFSLQSTLWTTLCFPYGFNISERQATQPSVFSPLICVYVSDIGELLLHTASVCVQFRVAYGEPA